MEVDLADWLTGFLCRRARLPRTIWSVKCAIVWQMIHQELAAEAPLGSWQRFGSEFSTSLIVSFRQQCMISWNNHALLPKAYRGSARNLPTHCGRLLLFGRRVAGAPVGTEPEVFRQLQHW